MSSTMSKAGLADLELPVLVERLVATSRDVRRAVAAGDYVAIARALDEVRTAADVAALVALVQERVEAATGVRLETELHWLGFEPADR